jgi:hypothetical protein
MNNEQQTYVFKTNYHPKDILSRVFQDGRERGFISARRSIEDAMACFMPLDVSGLTRQVREILEASFLNPLNEPLLYAARIEAIIPEIVLLLLNQEKETK